MSNDIVPKATIEEAESISREDRFNLARTSGEDSTEKDYPGTGHRTRDMTASSNALASRRKTMIFRIFALMCILVGFCVLLASLKKVPSTEMGVRYDTHKKQLDDASASGGLFIGPPGFRFIKFPSTFITVEVTDQTCVSNDGLLVIFSVTYQVRRYHFKPHDQLSLILRWRSYLSNLYKSIK
jgi:hypothetical protein